MENIKQIIKISIIGEGGVGKTSIVNSLLGLPFTPQITIGVELTTLSVYFKILQKQFRINYNIFDCGGQNRFKFLHSAYIKGSDFFLFIYDRSRPNTLNSFDEWNEIIKESNSNGNIAKIGIFGNKSDLIDIEQDNEEISRLYDSNNLEFIESGSIYDYSSILNLFKKTIQKTVNSSSLTNISFLNLGKK